MMISTAAAVAQLVRPRYSFGHSEMQRLAVRISARHLYSKCMWSLCLFQILFVGNWEQVTLVFYERILNKYDCTVEFCFCVIQQKENVFCRHTVIFFFVLAQKDNKGNFRLLDVLIIAI